MDITTGIIMLIILIFSAILHEVAHGFVAHRLGDPTARLLGRLTLNPIKHIDPFMSVLLPFMLIVSGSPVIFGAAKPVPIDPFNFRDGRKDIAISALAGPLTNLLIALAAAGIIKLLFILDPIVNFPGAFVSIAYYLLLIVVRINLLLAIFNLIPIPPLDGSKIFALILPEKEANSYLSIGSIGMIIIFLLLLFPIGGFSLGGLIFSLVNFSEAILGL